MYPFYDDLFDKAFGNVNAIDCDTVLKHRIPIDIFPIGEDGNPDIKATCRICQMNFKEIGFTKHNGKTYVAYINPQMSDKNLEKMKQLLTTWSSKKNPPAKTPICEPFQPNKCPDCGANLGGKLLDGYYENPYFERCPSCGIKLKKMPWQNDDMVTVNKRKGE